MSMTALYYRGIERMRVFCEANDMQAPRMMHTAKSDWFYSACAFWRPNYISICTAQCATPAPIERCRNWNWPGYSTDREPYGVIAHELGHCADYYGSQHRHRYSGDLSIKLRAASGEKPLTSYCPNDAEWFAEHFRLFVTNHALLALLRPATHALFMERWKPVSHDDWQIELGPDVPPRIIQAALNKIPKRRDS